jgi:hypothetical protein
MTTPDAYVGTPEDQRRFYETLVRRVRRPSSRATPLWSRSGTPAAWLFGRRAQRRSGHIDELVGQHEAIRDDAASLNDRVLDGPIEVVTRRARKDGTLVDVA